MIALARIRHGAAAEEHAPQVRPLAALGFHDRLIYAVAEVVVALADKHHSRLAEYLHGLLVRTDVYVIGIAAFLALAARPQRPAYRQVHLVSEVGLDKHLKVPRDSRALRCCHNSKTAAGDPHGSRCSQKSGDLSQHAAFFGGTQSRQFTFYIRRE